MSTPKTEKPKIEVLPIEQIKPYFRNPRRNEAAVAAVKQSIEQYGYNVPIVVDKKHVIITGHARYKALRELGWTEVPVIVSDLGPTKAKQYRIADNKTAEFADWDRDALVEELRTFSNIEQFQTYFPDTDLNAMLQERAGVDLKLPTQEQIAKREAEATKAFIETNDRELQDYVDVICPECGGEFAVRRSEVLRNTKE